MSKAKKNAILYPDNNNGIYLYEYPMINGIKQYVQMRGADKSNPLILFLHGGPGGSLAGVCHVMQAEWEKDFTVVNWDQRNTCKTYLANKDKALEIAETGSIDDFVQDIDEIIAYLHTVYDFEKLILMGFSWGSAIGAEYAKRHPENLLCYVGVGQHINYHDGVTTVCKQLLDIIPENSKDADKVKKILADFPEKPVWNNELFKIMKHYSPLTYKYIGKHARRVPIGKILTSPFMNFKERLAASIPNYSLLKKSYETMLTYDFRKNLNFEAPALFVFGKEETVCPSELLTECFDELTAPQKKISVIKNASHSCFYDQPQEFYSTLCDFIKSIKA